MVYWLHSVSQFCGARLCIYGIAINMDLKVKIPCLKMRQSSIGIGANLG